MVSSIPLFIFFLLLLLFIALTHSSSLDDDISNDQPNGFFLPFESNLYVEITIGTPTRTFNLKLDSSTHLTCLDNDDDHQCSLSDKSSNTFSTISCNSSSLCPHVSTNSTDHYNATTTKITSLSLLCTPSDFCRYEASPSSSGYLVSDTLQLTSSITDQENSLSIVRGFVFGFGTSNRASPNEDGGGVDGRVSLTTHRFSLLSQLRLTRFSHCLWPSTSGSRNYIRLGSVAAYGGDMILVPMLNTTGTEAYSYHVSLLGISLGQQRISNESSVIAIDIGTYYTSLEPSLHEEVKEELMTQIGPTIVYKVNELMCFTTEVGFDIDSLPKLTLHFQGFDYTISNKGLYLRDSPSSLCTALVRSSMEDEERINVLGASALVDQAVGYDTSQRMFAFQQRDCLADFVDGT
ncbi:PREDICTED: probable aspartic protease At2g35615 [Camelina sativa]|uniref:Probable aspartic protease At2g35615 n=1 Tax=Camelina sativa TaxID=90675 RepID=A0ABM0T5V5_CAMSA|nr:PREDICTED: probable aspartic protease At2g35615 [Camelina sativa]